MSVVRQNPNALCDLLEHGPPHRKAVAAVGGDTRSRTGHHRPTGKRPRFESPILHSAGLHHLAPGRKPLQNRGFLMRGRFGLRPPARQYGRLLTPFCRTLPHRSGEVILGHLQIVFRSDRLGVSDSVTDHLDRKLVGQFRLASTPQVLEQLRPRL